MVNVGKYIPVPWILWGPLIGWSKSGVVSTLWLILPSQGNLGEVENGKGHFFRGNYWRDPIFNFDDGKGKRFFALGFCRLTKCKIYSSMVTCDTRVRHGTKRCSHSITCRGFCKKQMCNQVENRIQWSPRRHSISPLRIPSRCRSIVDEQNPAK